MAKMFEFDDWFWIATFILGRLHWDLLFKGELHLGAFVLFTWGLFMLLEFKIAELEEKTWERRVFG